MDQFRGPLVGLIASWGIPWQEAQELAQETFVQAYLSQERFRGDRSEGTQLGAWLRGIAGNLYRDYVRARVKQRSHSDIPDELAGPAPDPSAGQEESALMQAMQSLSPEHRAVLWMHYLEETKIADVAELLGVTVKTVEGRLYQARKELKRKLDKEYGESKGPEVIV